MSAKLSTQINNLTQIKTATISPGDVFIGNMEGVDHVW